MILAQISSIAGSVGLAALYTAVGVILAILGFKVFDWCTPGDLTKEIVENRNVAAAIVGAAVIIAVAIIVHAAISG